MADMLLIINFVNTMGSLRSSESWTPLCLPRFNDGGFLYAYIVFIAEDICLLIITPKQTPEQFHHCQTAKTRIVEQLNSTSMLQSIQTALAKKDEGLPGQ